MTRDDGADPEPDDRLRGRTAVVTGGASGFGAALADAWAARGMAVAVLDIDAARARETADALARAHGVPTTAVGTDVGDADSVREAARHVDRTLGGCHVLCANVGVQQFGALDRLTDDDWAWVLGVNVMGTVRTVREFMPLLRAQTGWRHVVLTASSGVLVPGPRLGAYTTSKFAVVGFGETLRVELAPEGIGVTIAFPAGMTTRHLESSALARPEALGPSVTLADDIDVMLAGRHLGDSHVATAEEAVHDLVPQVLAGAPYVLTHGDYRAQYRQRRDELEAAFDRLEGSAA